MNTSTVSGFVQGKPELRVTRDGRRILNFEVAIEGPEPYAPIAYCLRPDETPTLEAGRCRSKQFASSGHRHDLNHAARISGRGKKCAECEHISLEQPCTSLART